MISINIVPGIAIYSKLKQHRYRKRGYDCRIVKGLNRNQTGALYLRLCQLPWKMRRGKKKKHATNPLGIGSDVKNIVFSYYIYNTYIIQWVLFLIYKIKDGCFLRIEIRWRCHLNACLSGRCLGLLGNRLKVVFFSATYSAVPKGVIYKLRSQKNNLAKNADERIPQKTYNAKHVAAAKAKHPRENEARIEIPPILAKKNPSLATKWNESKGPPKIGDVQNMTRYKQQLEGFDCYVDPGSMKTRNWKKCFDVKNLRSFFGTIRP